MGSDDLRRVIDKCRAQFLDQPAGSPVQKCPAGSPPPDVVIPIVFPDYLISVDNLSFVERTAIKATPGVSIESEKKIPGGVRYKIKGLGHAGIAFIDGKTGRSRYYEYGRYDPQEKGLVRSLSVPAVTIGSDKKPTKASLHALLREIAVESGHGTRISGVYVEVTDKFSTMEKYAMDREALNSNPNRKFYDLKDNNCFTFATQVARSAGVDVSMANKMFPSSSMEKMQNVYPSVNFDPNQKETVGGATQ